MGLPKLAERRLGKGDRRLFAGDRLQSEACPALFQSRLCVWQRHELASAIEDLSTAIRLDPKSAVAYYQRADLYEAEGDFRKAIADLTEAIRLDPKQPRTPYQPGLRLLGRGRTGEGHRRPCGGHPAGARRAGPHAMRGTIYQQKGDFEKAVADLDRAIELEPKSPGCYEIRAAMRLQQGDYDRGMADIQAALRLNAKDPAATFEDSPKSPLSPADLEHGRQQVGQMLADRPAMGQYGQRAADLLEWAARKFAGEDLHQRIFWDAVDPFSGATAERTAPVDGEPGAIRVRAKHSGGPDKGKVRPFETMWLEAVFELYNITNVEEFRRLVADAKAGKAQGERFVVRHRRNRGPHRREDTILLHPRVPSLGVGTRPRHRRFVARRPRGSERASRIRHQEE